MGLVNPSQSNAGDTIEASDINNPINQLAATINGNIDATNIADGSITPSKLAAASVNSTKVNFGGSGAGIWWEEIGRNTLTTAGDLLTVTFTARRYLRIIFRVFNSGALINIVRFNNDSTTTYAYRISTNGTADNGAASATSILGDAGSYNVVGSYEVYNIAAQEKSVNGWTISENVPSAVNLPGRSEITAKWSNTSAQITRVDVINTGAGDYAIGSELVILGHD